MNTPRQNVLFRGMLLTVILLVCAQTAFAHPQKGEAVGFLIGFRHPISGLDHVLAMVAVGLWGAQLGFGFLFALIMAAEPAMMAELFPGEYRLSGYSLSFNLGIGIAGGTAPLAATALIAATDNDLAPAWYLMIASVIAAGAAYLMTDWSRKPLR